MNKENLILMALPKRRKISSDSLQFLPSASVVTPKGKLKVAVSTHTWDGAEEEEAVEYFATHCSGLLRSSIRLCRKDDGHNGHNKPLSVSTMKFEKCSEELDLEITRAIEEENYIDVDSNNHRFLVYATPYAERMFKNFEEQVRNGPMIRGSLDEGARVPGILRSISPRWRSLLIEYLITFSTKARLFNTTLHLAVSILDRYLVYNLRSKKIMDVPLDRLMSVGVACLSISIKYEEPQMKSVSTLLAPLVALWKHVLRDPNPPSSEHEERRTTRLVGLRNRCPLKEMGGGDEVNMVVSPAKKRARDLQHAKSDLVQTEFQVLAGLSWNVSHPTTWTFLHRYATAGQLRGNQLSIAECLCDRILLDYGLQRHGPRMLAAAIVGLIRCLVSHPFWTPSLQHTTGLVSKDVEICMKDIQKVLSLEQGLRHKSAIDSAQGGPSSPVHAQQITAEVDRRCTNAKSTISTSKFHKYAGRKKMGGASENQPRVVMRATTTTEKEKDTEVDGSFPFSQDSRGSEGPVAYLPGNSVRSKHQDVVYRAIVELPEGGPDANAGGSTASRTGPNSAAPRVSPPLLWKENGQEGRSMNASGAVEPDMTMSRLHKRDALAAASYKVIFGLDQNIYHSFRHPSYSP